MSLPNRLARSPEPFSLAALALACVLGAAPAQAQDPGPADEAALSEEAPEPAGEQPQPPEEPATTEDEATDDEPETVGPADEAALSEEATGEAAREGDAAEEADPAATNAAAKEADSSEGADAAQQADAAPGEEPSAPPDDWASPADETGFAEMPTVAEVPTEPAPWVWGVTGSLKSDDALWVQRLESQPLARARQTGRIALDVERGGFSALLGVHAERDFAYLANRRDYDPATIALYESNVWLDESWLRFRRDKATVTTGRQYLAWGVGMVISPVDVLNPRDLRDLALADLDGLRLPVWSTRATLDLGGHQLEAGMVHEARFQYRSPPDGPYGQLDERFGGSGGPGSLGSILDDTNTAWRHDPQGISGASQQYFASWSYRGKPVDAALYVASTLDREGVIDGLILETSSDTPVASAMDLIGPRGPTESELDLVVRHPRYTMVGHSGALAVGDLLLQWEGHYDADRPFNTGTLDRAFPVIEVERRDVLGGMLGLTFSGFDDTHLAVEMGKDWVLEGEEDLMFPVVAPMYAFRAYHSALRDTLDVSLALTGFGWTLRQGSSVRGEVGYDLGSGWNLGGGVITYHPGKEDGPYEGLDEHAQVFLRTKWSFTLR